MAIGQDLLNVPMGDMIRQMALAIADAQIQLDESSMQVAEMMSGTALERDQDGNPILDGNGDIQKVDTRIFFGREYDEDAQKMKPVKASMMELGFTPTFYQFIDTIIEVKIAIKMTREIDRSRTTSTNDRNGSNSSSKSGVFKRIFGNNNKSSSYSARTTTVDATYSSKYSYSAEGSSLLRTKLTPVPPPAILEERIRDQIDAEETTEA
jgi:hypothetical protein